MELYSTIYNSFVTIHHLGFGFIISFSSKTENPWRYCQEEFPELKNAQLSAPRLVPRLEARQ